jgi:hypothetical protein
MTYWDGTPYMTLKDIEAEEIRKHGKLPDLYVVGMYGEHTSSQVTSQKRIESAKSVVSTGSKEILVHIAPSNGAKTFCGKKEYTRAALQDTKLVSGYRWCKQCLRKIDTGQMTLDMV